MNNVEYEKLEKAEFLRLWGIISSEVHEWAIERGFWEGEGCSVGEKIALMHSELSEALDAHRNDNPPDDKIPEFSGLEAELADTIIRIMDFCEKYDLRVAEALIAKINYNHTRPYKHGRVNY